MNERIKYYKDSLVKYYEIDIKDLIPLSSKSFKLIDNDGNKYFLKKTYYNVLEKYLFLENQGINNVLYPFKNRNNEYVTRKTDNAIYVSNFYEDSTIIKEVKIQNLFNELNKIHENTLFKRQLNPDFSRPKFEELTRRLDYKFNMLEHFVRSVEAKPLNIFSMPILSNYQYLLDAKKELVRLQKRLISSIKARESIEFCFLHNNPSLDHLLNINSSNYLISIDNSKIGIESLDLAKFYIENEDANIDFASNIIGRYNSFNPFYYDYFRFMILVIYITRLNISGDSYVNAQSFINTTNSIKKYFNNFKDLSSVNEDE